MIEPPQWVRSWRVCADVMGTLLLASLALWHYLLGQYESILLPASLSCLMAVITVFDTRRASRVSNYLLLLCGCLALYDQTVLQASFDAFWISVPITLILLVLPFGPALVLALAVMPVWLMVVGQSSPSLDQIVFLLTFLAVTSLAGWEYLRQRDLNRATDPSDADCDAINCATLHERLNGEFERAQHLDQRLAVVILHLPQLEIASEQYGSRTQLTQLDQLCQAVRLHCRDHDILGRESHDTFWLVLPNTTESGALLVIKRLEQALSEVRLADMGPLTLRSRLCALNAKEPWQHFEQRLARRSEALAGTPPPGRSCPP